jgi:hypothetical protein
LAAWKSTTRSKRYENTLSLSSIGALRAYGCAKPYSLGPPLVHRKNRIAQRKGQKQKADEQPGGLMAQEGTQPDKDHSSGKLTEEGKEAWRTGSGIDGGGKT